MFIGMSENNAQPITNGDVVIHCNKIVVADRIASIHFNSS